MNTNDSSSACRNSKIYQGDIVHFLTGRQWLAQCNLCSKGVL